VLRRARVAQRCRLAGPDAARASSAGPAYVLRSRRSLLAGFTLNLMLGFIFGYTLRFIFGFTSPCGPSARIANSHGDLVPRSVADIFI
jgi:hypothetical protein